MINLSKILNRISEVEDQLNDWESNFVETINKCNQFGWELSLKQEKCLLRIYDKYCPEYFEYDEFKHEEEDTNKNNQSSSLRFTPYEILGIPKNSSKQEIKKRYHSLALKYHPDRMPPDEKSIGNIIMGYINTAYQAISK